MGLAIAKEWRSPGLSPVRKMTTKEKYSKHQKTPEHTMRRGDTGAVEAVACRQKDRGTGDPQREIFG